MMTAVCLLSLLAQQSPHTGVSGQDTSFFYGEGDDAILFCNDWPHLDCSLQTWTFKSTVVAFGGKISEGQERLSLGSDCSLLITKVTVQDAGSYSCQQLPSLVTNFQKVFVLRIQQPNGEKKPGSGITLTCSLQDGNAARRRLLYRTGLALSWVDDTGKQIKSYNYKWLDSYSTDLTLWLKAEDNHRKWTCQVTMDGVVKATVSYISKLTVPTTLPPPTPMPVTPVPNTNSPGKTTNSPVVLTEESLEVILRATIFTILILLPVIIGSALYIQKRRHRHQDYHSDIELRDKN